MYVSNTNVRNARFHHMCASFGHKNLCFMLNFIAQCQCICLTGQVITMHHFCVFLSHSCGRPHSGVDGRHGVLGMRWSGTGVRWKYRLMTTPQWKKVKHNNNNKSWYKNNFLEITFFISRPARRREIIICTMCVCTCVRACVGACVRACVTQFSLKLLQLHIFGKSQVLMNFFALQYFGDLVNFGLLLSE